MRKHYVDNLRWMCVLLLFPFHTAMLYNDWGENFYIYSHPQKFISAFDVATAFWFMPLMFVLAGVSSFYALQRRSAGEYAKERFFRLFVPLVFGLLLLIPAQTYFAERFHNGFTGSYLDQYVLFFTKPTDLTGYIGGFTPGHLWFILYLFVISLLALPIMRWYGGSAKKLDGAKFTLPKLLPLFVLPAAMSLVLDIGGKSIGEFLSLFLLGFFLLGNEEILQRLERRRWPLFAASVLLTAGKLVAYFRFHWVGGVPVGLYDRLAMWVCILMFFGMGRRFFNQRNTVTAYLAKASFPIYILHQTCLVATAYYVVRLTSSVAVQAPLIMLISAALTFFTYEILRRIPVTRWMFGMK